MTHEERSRFFMILTIFWKWTGCVIQLSNMDFQDYQIEKQIRDILKYVKQWCHTPSWAMHDSQCIPPTTFSRSASSSRMTMPLYHTDSKLVNEIDLICQKFINRIFYRFGKVDELKEFRGTLNFIRALARAIEKWPCGYHFVELH